MKFDVFDSRKQDHPHTLSPGFSITRSIARQFAMIRGDLRAKGLLIPDPDLYIAATAIQHCLTLVTRNTRDYDRIPNLEMYQAS